MSLLAFYWFLGSGKVMKAYTYGTIGAALWLVVGVATTFFAATGQLPSLIFMETAVIFMNIRGIINWRKVAKKENNETVV
ncbi:hypothetical protein KAR91_86990 [Candidatus Pacearchaeota archaeon]|nr:hypothetical protein [Candidatus Pacearchaeota archaeon]